MWASPDTTSATTTSDDRLLRRNPGLPVVTWNTPFAIPCGNESGGGENHKTTVATPQNLSEITIPGLMKQSSEENQRLHERRTTDDCGDSTRVSISRREDNGEQEHLRPTIIRTQTCSHGRSSIEAGGHGDKV